MILIRKNLANIFSLACVQGANALLPIFIFPYVLHLIGAEKYRDLVVSEAIGLIVLAIVLYSYEINGVTRSVHALKQEGVALASTVFSEVMCSRLIIWAFCVGVVLISGVFLAHDVYLSLLCWMLLPLAYIFQSTYFFQALENNVPVAVLSLVSRLACCGIVFTYLQPSDPTYFLPLIVGCSYLVGGFFSTLYLLFVVGVKFTSVSWKNMWNSLVDGKEIFSGNFAVVLFRDSNLLVLSFFGVSAASVASYSVVEKFIKAFQAVIRPLNQFFFPRVIHAVYGRPEPDKIALYRILRLTYLQLMILLLILIAIVTVWVLLNDEVAFLSSYPDKPLMANLFLLMSVGVFFGVSNFMLGTAGLNSLNAKRYLAKSLIATGILTLTLCVASTKLIGVYGAAASFVFGEVMLFLLILRRYLKSGC